VLEDYTYVKVCFYDCETANFMELWIEVYVSEEIQDFIIGEPTQMRLGATNKEHILLKDGFKIARGSMTAPRANVNSVVFGKQNRDEDPLAGNKMNTENYELAEFPLPHDLQGLNVVSGPGIVEGVVDASATKGKKI